MSENITRREIIKRAVYITPTILTLAAVPNFAKAGSYSPQGGPPYGVPPGPPTGIPPGPPYGVPPGPPKR